MIVWLQITVYIVSVFIRDYTRFNLYFGVDITLTLMLAGMLPALRKEVGENDLLYRKYFYLPGYPTDPEFIIPGRKDRKFTFFVIVGMGMCLLSAYVSSFLAGYYRADTAAAIREITPVCEEVMKFLPLLIYLAVFEPA